MESRQWEQLITERNAWVAHNFPGPDMPNSLIGVFEECGELAHCHLKEKQAIRGTAEEHVANAKDAVGDIIIYLLGMMNDASYVPHQVTHPPLGDEDIDELLLTIGATCGALILNRQGSHMIQQMVNAVQRYCEARGWDFDHIVISTWERVSKRDWIAAPADGGDDQPAGAHLA